MVKDREALLAFCDLPAEHWDHLRTTNPIESVFATVRHRTVRTKGSLSPTTARLMVFKLVIAASKTWRRLADRKPSLTRSFSALFVTCGKWLRRNRRPFRANARGKTTSQVCEKGAGTKSAARAHNRPRGRSALLERKRAQDRLASWRRRLRRKRTPAGSSREEQILPLSGQESHQKRDPDFA